MSDARVTIEVEAGEIKVEIFSSRAPRSAAYFLDLVAQRVYDGSCFYRSTTLGAADGPRLLQGGPLAGLFTPEGPAASVAAKRMDLLADFETTEESGLQHAAGTISLARDLSNTGHAIPEFFICLGPFPELDTGGRSEPDTRGFPAFGRVTSGLELVADIAHRATQGRSRIARLEGEVLSQPVRILRVARSSAVVS